jgi:serine O-acetyltransferase
MENSIIEKITGRLIEGASSFRSPSHNIPLPDIQVLHQLMDRMRKVLFPGFFGHHEVHDASMKYYIGAHLDSIQRELGEQVYRGFGFSCRYDSDCVKCRRNSDSATNAFLEKLPIIRDLLYSDAEAAFRGDPAAKSPGEAIFCYPSMKAMLHHRIAHELLVLGVPLIPRIIAEIAHTETGIDIHPGAQIGPEFFIDHGTGVVIGETSVIGKNVRLYQGVTLGAKSFPLDAEGKPIKDIPRHPLVDDDVIVYANSTLLGRIHIGKGAVIGGNMWITTNIPAEAKIFRNLKNETAENGEMFINTEKKDQ